MSPVTERRHEILLVFWYSFTLIKRCFVRIMSVPFDMLLHPELLSNEQLIGIIQEVIIALLLLYQNLNQNKKRGLIFVIIFHFQRHLRIPNMCLMQRDELLDIFHHYCVPYGQRKYRDSGRGKILNKTRQPSPDTTKKINMAVNQEIKRSISNPNCERLRPPQESLSSQIKRIKIETTIAPIIDTTNFSNLSKRKICIDSVSTALKYV